MATRWDIAESWRSIIRRASGSGGFGARHQLISLISLRPDFDLEGPFPVPKVTQEALSGHSRRKVGEMTSFLAALGAPNIVGDSSMGRQSQLR